MNNVNELQRRVNAEGLISSGFYNDHERAFLSVLQKAVGSNYYVLEKVKVLDILCFSDADRLHSTLANKMLRTCTFDYLICHNISREIVCAVELEEGRKLSYFQQKWQRHLQQLIDDSCSKTALSRLIVQQQSGYLLNQLIERFEAVVHEFEPI